MTAPTTPRRRPSKPRRAALDSSQPTTPTDRPAKLAPPTPTPEDRERGGRQDALRRASTDRWDVTDKFVEGVYTRRALEDLDAHECRVESFLTPLAPEPPATPRDLELAADECRIPGIEPEEIARIAAEIRSGFDRARDAIRSGKLGDITNALGWLRKLQEAEWRDNWRESIRREHEQFRLAQSARASHPRGPRNAERNAAIRAAAEKMRTEDPELSVTEIARTLKKREWRGYTLSANTIRNILSSRASDPSR